MMNEGIGGMGEGIVVVWPNQTSTTYKGIGPGRRVRVTESDIGAAEKLPLIKTISAEYADWSVSMKYEDRLIPKQVRGVYPNYGGMRKLFPENGGRFLNRLDEDRRRRVIFIGSAWRNRFLRGVNNEKNSNRSNYSFGRSR